MNINPIIRSILSHFRGCTIRSYLVVLPDQSRIEKQLKLEDLHTERGVLDLRSHELALKQKRVEANLTDLTRCIRGMEFDLKVNSNRGSKERKADRRPPADKKSPKVGDFSE
ncbi:uncharacterized protein LOC27207588 [Drosophila simulans]|uniref:GD25030 n=1 Tax=Drosophila simulans TaxID=7240 RepID=B4QAW4_DROSI|nr:uncharacterized protein LOC27207588 [Drosophila simulans]EDX08401.1 GD25030 [Drosophila simulans]KMY96065.1 uncharacterized protein Dsimw501_GD27739 [Drosophila simulans]